MMRFMAGCSGAWALAAIVLVGCGASAQMMVVEGYADVNLALITPGTIVCSTRVSGEDSEELFALDTKTGTVTWRQRDQRIDAKALADETGAFYLFANDFLQKRDLRTGVIVWQSKLDSIPEQITPPKLSLEDYWQIFLTRLKLAPPPPMTLSLRSFSSPPNCYYYETVASRSALNGFRQAM